MKSLSIGHYGVSHSCYEVTGVTWQTEQLQSIHLRYIRGRREEQLCAEWVCYALEKGHRIPPRRKSLEHMDREPGVPERISKYRKALGKEQGSADPDRTSPARFAIANRIADVVYEGRSGGSERVRISSRDRWYMVGGAICTRTLVSGWQMAPDPREVT